MVTAGANDVLQCHAQNAEIEEYMVKEFTAVMVWLKALWPMSRKYIMGIAPVPRYPELTPLLNNINQRWESMLTAEEPENQFHFVDVWNFLVNMCREGLTSRRELYRDWLHFNQQGAAGSDMFRNSWFSDDYRRTIRYGFVISHNFEGLLGLA